MRGLVAVLAGVVALLQVTTAAATSAVPSPSPSVSASPVPTPTPVPRPAPSASPSVAPSAAASASPSPEPSPAASPAATAAEIAGLQSRIGKDLAGALVKQQKLADALAADTAQQDALTNQVNAAQDQISALEDQVAALDVQIQDTQDRIDVEKGQVAALARALARRPNSVLLVLARSRSIGDALRGGADLLVAGQRAHRLQVKLEADLAKLNRDRQARQDDLDREVALQASLQTSLDDLSAQLSREQDVATTLDDLLSQFQSALDGLGPDTSPADTQALLDLLEEQQRSVNDASVATAWTAASVGAGQVQVLTNLPRVVSGHFIVPIAGAVLTQGFGPTDLWFEPPLGSFPHFHTGLDLAAP